MEYPGYGIYQYDVSNKSSTGQHNQNLKSNQILNDAEKVYEFFSK